MSSATGALIDEGALSETAEKEAGALARGFRQNDLLRGGLCIADQAVVSAASFATSLMIGRTCTREELGLYYLAMTLVLLARGVQEQLVSAPYVVFASRRSGTGAALYAGSSLAHQTAIAAVGCLAVLALLVALSMGIGPAGLTSTCAVLLPVLPCLLLREYLRQFAFAHVHVGMALALDVTVSLLQVGGLALLAWNHAVSAPAAYGVLGLACACGLLLVWPRRRQPMAFSQAAVGADWRENWSFGRWALAGHLLGAATAYLMPWILTAARGEAATGFLAACLTLVGLANMFITGLSNYLSPHAARAFAAGGTKQLQVVLFRATVTYSAVLACFCAAMLFAGDELLQLAYGGRYANSGGLLPILALNLWVGSLGVVAGNGLWAMNHPRSNFWADGCLLFVSLAAAALLMPALGTLGAALAMLAGSVGGTSVRISMLLRCMAWEANEPVMVGE